MKKNALTLSVALLGLMASAAVAVPTYVASNGGFDYYLSSGRTTWTAAEAEAQSIGGHLASIHNATDNTFIHTTFASPAGGWGVWLGLNDAAVEGSYVWSDGTPYDYQNWNPGEPNNDRGDEDYVNMWTSGTWNDLPNSLALLPGVIQVRSKIPDGGSSIGLLSLSLIGVFGAKRLKK